MTADIAYMQNAQQPLSELNDLFTAQRQAYAGNPMPSAAQRQQWLKVLRDVLDTRLGTLKPIVSKLSATHQEQLEKILSLLIEDSVNSEMDAVSVCRLCDDQVCPEDDCPAHHKLDSLDS